MTTRAAAARGIVDPSTGRLLAMSASRVWWFGADHEHHDITPDHEWRCVATGGGAVLLAGEGRLTWCADGRSVTRDCPVPYRVAVSGRLVAGACTDGTVLVWPDVLDSRQALGLEVGFEPDGVALDAAHRRVAVWGWQPDDAPGLVVLSISAHDLTPTGSVPAPARGVVGFPLGDGALALASAHEIVAVAPDGRVLGGLPVAHVEQLACRGSTLAWLRSDDPDDPRLTVGTATLDGSGLSRTAEAQVPALADPFPHLAVTPSGPVVVSSSGARTLVRYRLDADGRWSEPTEYLIADPPEADVPDSG